MTEPDNSQALSFLEHHGEFRELYDNLCVAHVTSSVYLDSILEKGLVPDPPLFSDDVKIFLNLMFESYGPRQHSAQDSLEENVRHGARVAVSVLGMAYPTLSGDHLKFGMPQRVQVVARALNAVSENSKVHATDHATATRLFEEVTEPFLRASTTKVMIQLDPEHSDVMTMLLPESLVLKMQLTMADRNIPGYVHERSHEWNAFRINFADTREVKSVTAIDPDAIATAFHGLPNVTHLPFMSPSTLKDPSDMFPLRRIDTPAMAQSL